MERNASSRCVEKKAIFIFQRPYAGISNDFNVMPNQNFEKKSMEIDQALPLNVMLNQRQARVQECRKCAAELVGLPELCFLHFLGEEEWKMRGLPGTARSDDHLHS